MTLGGLPLWQMWFRRLPSGIFFPKEGRGPKLGLQLELRSWDPLQEQDRRVRALLQACQLQSSSLWSHHCGTSGTKSDASGAEKLGGKVVWRQDQGPLWPPACRGFPHNLVTDLKENQDCSKEITHQICL